MQFETNGSKNQPRAILCPLICMPDGHIAHNFVATTSSYLDPSCGRTNLPYHSQSSNGMEISFDRRSRLLQDPKLFARREIQWIDVWLSLGSFHIARRSSCFFSRVVGGKSLSRAYFVGVAKRKLCIMEVPRLSIQVLGSSRGSDRKLNVVGRAGQVLSWSFKGPDYYIDPGWL